MQHISCEAQLSRKIVFFNQRLHQLDRVDPQAERPARHDRREWGNRADRRRGRPTRQNRQAQARLPARVQ